MKTSNVAGKVKGRVSSLRQKKIKTEGKKTRIVLFDSQNTPIK